MATKTASDNAATQQRRDDMVSPTRWNDFSKQRSQGFAAHTIRGESLLRVLCNDYAAECRLVPMKGIRKVKSKRSLTEIPAGVSTKARDGLLLFAAGRRGKVSRLASGSLRVAQS